ncbi:MAG: hypothetical protein MdMp014T_1501 [Treponematales bacterium]
MQAIKAIDNGEVFVPFTPVSLPRNQTVYIMPAGDGEEAGCLEPERFNAETIAALEDTLAERSEGKAAIGVLITPLTKSPEQAKLSIQAAGRRVYCNHRTH